MNKSYKIEALIKKNYMILKKILKTKKSKSYKLTASIMRDYKFINRYFDKIIKDKKKKKMQRIREERRKYKSVETGK